MSLESFNELIDTGCAPPGEIAVIKAGPSNRTAFLTDGRTDPSKLSRLRDQGYTIRFGNMQRWLPAFHRISQGIQRETGYSNYMHGFLTPGREQGLLHHWDQQMAVIVQVAGTKTWQLWKPAHRVSYTRVQRVVPGVARGVHRRLGGRRAGSDCRTDGWTDPDPATWLGPQPARPASRRSQPSPDLRHKGAHPALAR
ncbi:JmjC domain-containing protein [Streptomyces parvulus]